MSGGLSSSASTPANRHGSLPAPGTPGTARRPTNGGVAKASGRPARFAGKRSTSGTAESAESAASPSRQTTFTWITSTRPDRTALRTSASPIHCATCTEAPEPTMHARCVPVSRERCPSRPLPSGGQKQIHDSRPDTDRYDPRLELNVRSHPYGSICIAPCRSAQPSVSRQKERYGAMR